jgi:cytochrome c oxidase subunit II
MFSISTTVGEIDKAFYFIFGISLFFLVTITSTMIYFVIRYSRKRNPVASDIEEYLPLEIAWTVIPTLLTLGMFYYGWMSFMILRNVPQGATEITVQARRYNWMFKYENGRVTPELYVAAGRPVKLNLTSSDVIHGFYVPAYKLKEDVVPGQTNYVSFTPLVGGEFDIFCSSYCGVGHSAMHALLRVMSPKDFDLWYKKREAQKPLNVKEMFAGTPQMLARGKVIFESQCASCHGLTGKGDQLATARNFTTLEGWKNGDKISQMFRSITNGVGKEMPSFSYMPAEDRFAVIHYEQHFASGHHTDTPQDIQQLDAQYGISKGSAAPQEIPVSEAMQDVAKETATTIETPSAMLDDEALRKLQSQYPVGASLYASHCASCHGERGQGKAGLKTLDPALASRLNSLSLILPDRPWRAAGIDVFRLRIRESSLATGGVKPDFATLSASEWNALFEYVKALLPPGAVGNATGK